MLSSDQILALSPDAASAKAGRELAHRRKWVSVGKNGDAVWGECQGSGSKPYQTQIDLSEPAFKCSCPSRKFPCKHGLGLFLLLSEEPGSFGNLTPPDWVTNWLESRKERAATKAEAAAKPIPDAPADDTARAKRAAQRENKVERGLEELDLWLRDLVRGGIADAGGKPYKFWDTAGARLVDAQAPGLARRVRDLAYVPTSGEGWQACFLEQMSLLHLIVSGYRRIESLPAPLQADIRTAVGFPQKAEDLEGEPGVRDLWFVLGQSIEEGDKLRSQRIWLVGQQTRRFALLLNFAFGNAPFEIGLPDGSAFEGELAFFPSHFPLRAVLRERVALETRFAVPYLENIGVALGAYNEAKCKVPWLERHILPLADVTLVRDKTGWAVYDTANHLLPVTPAYDPYFVLAQTGGHPFGLCGEWNGRFFQPIAAVPRGGYTSNRGTL